MRVVVGSELLNENEKNESLSSKRLIFGRRMQRIVLDERGVIVYCFGSDLRAASKKAEDENPAGIWE